MDRKKFEKPTMAVVVDAWSKGFGASSNGTLVSLNSGGGNTWLSSYGVLIAMRNAKPDGSVSYTVIDFTGKNKLSQTTSRHVGLAKSKLESLIPEMEEGDSQEIRSPTGMELALGKARK